MNLINFRNKKVCAISDTHIGVHQNNTTWHEISLNFAKWLDKTLKAEGIEDIIICGDVNNDRSEISVSTMCVINRFFKVLSDYNIVITVGNHDAYYRDRSDVNSLSLLSEWDNITVVDAMQSVDLFDNKLTFCPWATPLESIPQSDIIFGHFDITGFKMNRSKICADGIGSEEVLDKSNLIVTGHFHLKEERKYKSGTILYLGSPYEISWGEYGDPKGIHLLDLETKEFEFIENTISPKHKKIRLSELLAKKKITKDIKDEFPNNFINFIIDQEINTDKIDALITKLSSFKPISIKTEFELDGKYNLDEGDYEFTGIDIPASIAEFIDLLSIDNKKEVLETTLDLYRRVS